VWQNARNVEEKKIVFPVTKLVKAYGTAVSDEKVMKVYFELYKKN